MPAATARARHIARPPQAASLLRLAGTKEGLEPRDLPPTVSFFKGVRVDGDGSLTWTGSAGPGASVDLVAEMPLTILIANAAHPLDPRDDYTVSPLRVHAWSAAASAPADPWWGATPERTRAYLNTHAHVLTRGSHDRHLGHLRSRLLRPLGAERRGSRHSRPGDRPQGGLVSRGAGGERPDARRRGR
ncbi:DUF1989 domain-containing protein [Demequina litorisediminis]|uniref:DUF1989 domain-containing protein n=1 Tax=Demequina litorisediminis TaxID=1849022 RepID=UPI0024E11859|nr:DUF1989 domain-containing protein [Demequina litorisediminis]